MSNAIEILPRIKFFASFLARLPSRPEFDSLFRCVFREYSFPWPLCRIASVEAILAGITVAAALRLKYAQTSRECCWARAMLNCSAPSAALCKLFRPAQLQV